MNTHNIDLAAEIWAASQKVPGEGIEDAIERIETILEAALQSQGREDAYIPKKRKDYVASITDSDGHIAQREGYVEGWNDCRQDIIDHARRVEGEAK